MFVVSSWRIYHYRKVPTHSRKIQWTVNCGKNKMWNTKAWALLTNNMLRFQVDYSAYIVWAHTFRSQMTCFPLQMTWNFLNLILPQGTKHSEYKGTDCTIFTGSLIQIIAAESRDEGKKINSFWFAQIHLNLYTEGKDAVVVNGMRTSSPKSVKLQSSGFSYPHSLTVPVCSHHVCY